MRQPKYQFGQKLWYKFSTTSPTGVEHIVLCSGIVCAIEYDPANGSRGAPFYQYKLEGFYVGKTKTAWFDERDLADSELAPKPKTIESNEEIWV